MQKHDRTLKGTKQFLQAVFTLNKVSCNSRGESRRKSTCQSFDYKAVNDTLQSSLLIQEWHVSTYMQLFMQAALSNHL